MQVRPQGFSCWFVILLVFFFMHCFDSLAVTYRNRSKHSPLMVNRPGGVKTNSFMIYFFICCRSLQTQSSGVVQYKGGFESLGQAEIYSTYNSTLQACVEKNVTPLKTEHQGCGFWPSYHRGTPPPSPPAPPWIASTTCLWLSCGYPNRWLKQFSRQKFSNKIQLSNPILKEVLWQACSSPWFVWARQEMYKALGSLYYKDESGGRSDLKHWWREWIFFFLYIISQKVLSLNV